VGAVSVTWTPGVSRSVAAPRALGRTFLTVSALLFATSVAVTIVWCGSMSAMGDVRMPGGWTMSMLWMRPSGLGWVGAGASFIGMWGVMMVAMMLPSFVPELWRLHLALGSSGAGRPGALTVVVGLTYFIAWTLVGVAVFPLGVSIAALMMGAPALARAGPMAAGAMVLFAGALQLTSWKAHPPAIWRHSSPQGRTVGANTRAAVNHGIRLTLECGRCCLAYMAILLAVGIMDLRAMALVTTGITVERLASDAVRARRMTGVVALGTGLFLIVRAMSLR
jgi:predicted metal-binding membrane protein